MHGPVQEGLPGWVAISLIPDSRNAVGPQKNTRSTKTPLMAAMKNAAYAGKNHSGKPDAVFTLQA